MNPHLSRAPRNSAVPCSRHRSLGANRESARTEDRLSLGEDVQRDCDSPFRRGHRAGHPRRSTHNDHKARGWPQSQCIEVSSGSDSTKLTLSTTRPLLPSSPTCGRTWIFDAQGQSQTLARHSERGIQAKSRRSSLSAKSRGYVVRHGDSRGIHRGTLARKSSYSAPKL
jgi:hypothetical protein